MQVLFVFSVQSWIQGIQTKEGSPGFTCTSHTEHTFSASVPECSWKPTYILLGPHFPPKLVGSWLQEGRSWPQVGAKRAPRALGKPSQNKRKRHANKRWSKSATLKTGDLSNPSWGPLRGFKIRGNMPKEPCATSETFPPGLEALGRITHVDWAKSCATGAFARKPTNQRPRRIEQTKSPTKQDSNKQEPN